MTKKPMVIVSQRSTLSNTTVCLLYFVRIQEEREREREIDFIDGHGLRQIPTSSSSTLAGLYFLFMMIAF